MLAVTVFDEPRLEVALEQRYDRGDSRGFRSWLILPRNWGPAPEADGRRAEPPLRDSALEMRAFRCVPAVLDPSSSARSADWEHDLIDVSSGLTWRCVWVRSGDGSPRRWPNGGVTLTAPQEWLGALAEAYRSARSEQRRDNPPGVSHLMGLPVESGQGVVLQVSFGMDVRSQAQQLYWSPSSGSARAGSPPPGSPAWLTVIQVTPEDGTFHHDANTAALTRRLALDTQLEMGSWVLALPALPPDVAREACRILGRLAKRRHVQRERLVKCVGDIKHLIVKGRARTTSSRTQGRRPMPGK